MRTLLLLLLSLMTCAEATLSVAGCPRGWVEFSCKYPSHSDYINAEVKHDTYLLMKSIKKNEWERRDRLSLYSDTKNKKVKVSIKQLQQGDIGEWSCKFGSRYPTPIKLGFNDNDVCQQAFDKTANEYDKTTLTCEYPNVQYKDVFFCKENSSTCEDVPSGTFPQSVQKFFQIKTNNGFSVFISPVSKEHKGVYWCGLKRKTGDYRFGVKKIELKVKGITSFKRPAPVGGTFNYYCESHDNEPEIFICKGDDPSLCKHLISTTGQETSDERFIIKQDRPDYFNITLRDVQYNDSGMYWCGAKSTDKTTSEWFFHRMTLTVVPSPSTPAAVTKSTPAPTEGDDHQWMFILGIIGSVLLLLLLVLVSFLIYKCLPKTRSKRNEATTSNIREDYVYEEIQERAQNPDSNAVAKTIYATLDHPTNSSAALHYASISFQQSPNSARAKGLVLKPPSSTCEYSSVKTSQSPVGSVCSGPSGEPLYSTVNKKL